MRALPGVGVQEVKGAQWRNLKMKRPQDISKEEAIPSLGGNVSRPEQVAIPPLALTMSLIHSMWLATLV